MKDPDGHGDDKKKRQGALTRRSAVVGLVAITGGLLGLRGWSREARLLPPGAGTGGEFERKCIRCLRCAAVCPVKAIRFDSSTDLSGSDLPYIDAQTRACILCMKCTEACPTGALTPIEKDPEIVYSAVRMGRPDLDKGLCIAWLGSGECRACYYVCPYPDRAVRLEGVLLAPEFDAQACVGCGLCEEACPERARAVSVRPSGA